MSDRSPTNRPMPLRPGYTEHPGGAEQYGAYDATTAPRSAAQRDVPRTVSAARDAEQHGPQSPVRTALFRAVSRTAAHLTSRRVPLNRDDTNGTTVLPVPPAWNAERDTERSVPRPTARARTAPRTVAAQWGKLTSGLSPRMRKMLNVLSLGIAAALITVLVAPYILSAQDIIAWAMNPSTEAGLGLGHQFAVLVFLAMDVAAGLCVLVWLYATLVQAKATAFVLFVWLFALASAYANYSQGSRPGAPGDAWWFFPLMSVAGPTLLHFTLKFLRKRLTDQAGGERAKRAAFPISDWLPLLGSPQETFGAWRVSAALSIETPEAALWAYRAICAERGWVLRWFVRGPIRAAQLSAMRDAFRAGGALNIPALLPPGALVYPGAPEQDQPDTERPASVVPSPTVHRTDLRTVEPAGRGDDAEHGTGQSQRSTGPDTGRQNGAGGTGDPRTDPSRGTRDGTAERGTVRLNTRDQVDMIPASALRYAQQIVAISDQYQNWTVALPSVRKATAAISAAREAGYNSTSTTQKVLLAMRELAELPDPAAAVASLRRIADPTTDV